MDDRPTYAPAVCRECGAAYPLTGQKCWLCGADLPERAALTTAPTSENPFAASAHRTFSLSSLFLVMTLAAVCLGVFAAAPGVGVALAIVATPALVRTMVVSSRGKARGSRLSPTEKVWTFAASACLLVVVIAAAGIAFFYACATVVFGNPFGVRTPGVSQAVGLATLVLCVLVGIGVPVGLFYIFWGRKPPRWFARPWESALARSKLARVFFATFVVGSLISLSSVSRGTIFVHELLFPIVLVGILVGWPFLTALILRRSAAPVSPSLLATALAALAFILLLTATPVLFLLGGSWLGSWLFLPLRWLVEPSQLSWPIAAACAATTDYWLCTRLWPALTHQKD